MKKVINYILLSAIMVTLLPYSTLAATTNVGVNITGEVSIEVVTTISADITLDLTTGETTPTYMEIQNNSLVPVSAKITNISTTSEGAPSTFVGTYDKDWNSLSKADTKKYVNFNIIGEGQNVSAKDILPNTEVNLGTLDVKSSSEYDCPETGLCMVGYHSDTKIFEINANFGKNWDSGDKNFTYQIETVYTQADKYEDPTLAYNYPDSVTPNIKSMKLYGIYTYEDLSNFEYQQSLPEESSYDYYYLLSLDVENGIGGYSVVESNILLFHRYNKQKDAGVYNLFLHEGDNFIHQNYVATLNAETSYYGLVVPASIKKSELNSTSNYKTINFEMVHSIFNGTSWEKKPFGDEYNYTYIIKTIVNE